MKTKAPIIQQHELTARCNNNCQFCYNPERFQEEFNIREADRKKNIIIAEISIKQGVMAVCPTGGEPLLVGEHLFEILSIYRQVKCYTSINSNGRLITPEVAERFAALRLNSALVSLHGFGSLHNLMVGRQNAFKETWNGILNLRRNGIPVTPNFVATSQNLHGLEEIGLFLTENGFASMTVTPFLPSWGAALHNQFVLEAKHYRMYFKALKRIRRLGMKVDSTLPIPPCVLIKFFPDNWEKYLDVHSPRVCMAGRSFGVVSPDGYFRACIQAPFLSDFGGNVLENYQRSWSQANEWAERKLLPEVCLKCEALDICGGGCRTSCLWENQGSPVGSTMYIGEALNQDEARPFIEKVVVNINEGNSSIYQWKSGIKFRNEGWGTIVFNPKNQSFTILSSPSVSIGDEKRMTFSSAKVAKVLSTIGAIKRVSGDSEITIDRVNVLPAQNLLPRLALNLNSEEMVYCLRADTGERYFF